MQTILHQIATWETAIVAGTLVYMAAVTWFVGWGLQREAKENEKRASAR